MGKRIFEPPVHADFSTEGMLPETGFDFWREQNCTSTMPNRIEPLGIGNFIAQGWSQRIGDLDLINNACNQDFAVHVEHDKFEISRSHDKPCLFVQSTCQSSSIKYGRRDEVLLFPGDWVLVSPSDTFWMHTEHSMGELHFLMLPAKFGKVLPSEDVYGRPMTSRKLLNKLVTNYIRTLAQGGPLNDKIANKIIADNLANLIIAALCSEQPGTHERCQSGIASGLRLAISQFLDTNYTQPDLTPSLVAARFGITPRYVHRLFEHTGTTFMEELFRRRLQHAHQLLVSPLYQKLSITDIAYECGFNDLAHFGRRYRKMYGLSPSDRRTGVYPENSSKNEQV